MAGKPKKRRLVPPALKAQEKEERKSSRENASQGAKEGRTEAKTKADASAKPKKPREPRKAPPAPVTPAPKRKVGRPRIHFPERRRPGRPHSYSPQFAERAKNLCMLGLNNKQVADSLGISWNTFHRWQREFPAFRDALCAGREQADATIAKSLFHRAKGYQHRAVKIFKPKGEEVSKVSYVEHYPPDTAAAIHWLNVRASKHGWKSKSEQALTGGDGGPVQIRSLNEMEAAQEVAFLLGRAVGRGAPRAPVTPTPDRPPVLSGKQPDNSGDGGHDA